MYEKMKLKYRKLISDKGSSDTILLLDDVLTNLQNILVKEQVYYEEHLLNQIESLKVVDNNLYDILYSDIKNKKLLEME